MNIQKLKSYKHGFAAIFMLLTMFVTPLGSVMPVSAAANNGDLKVHEFGTPDKTENNDPKICSFDLEGFNLDDGQTGYILFTAQGNDQPVGTDSGPYGFGPADADGYAASQYFNVPGGATIVNGHYKATLYGKDLGGNINLADEKAKSKVFKVECDEGVTPADVTFVDTCGTANDTYTIPTTPGVSYQINGQTVLAGTYAGTGTVTVTAVADTGFVLTGTAQWSHDFSAVLCEQENTPVTPDEVVFLDLCGTAKDTYTIPSTPHVSYQINGQTVLAGTYAGTGSVTVTAVADASYVLTGTAQWSHDFTDEACPLPTTTASVPPMVDLACDEDGSYTIPDKAGITYQINGQTVAAGTYFVTQPGTIVVTAVADANHVLTGPAEWTLTFHAPEDCEVPPTDVCPNIEGPQAVVPAGMLVNTAGDCVTPPTPIGHVLGDTTTTPSTTTTPATTTTPSTEVLATTGRAAFINLAVGLCVIGSAALVTVLSRGGRNAGLTAKRRTARASK